MSNTITRPDGFSVDHLPSALRAAFEEREVYTPDGDKIALDSNISLDEALTLYSAVRESRPSVSAEVGFAKGVSATTILKALEDNRQGEHHVMDPFQKRWQYTGLEMARRSGLSSRLHFYETFAEDVVPNLPRLQFAFIDASHLFDLTLVEFVLLDKKLEVGGLLGLHDMWMPSLQKVLRFILANRSYEVHQQTPPKQAQDGYKRRVKHALARALSQNPAAKRVFAPELLAPWSQFSTPNLVLLRKMDEDKRDWRFHTPF